MAPLLVLTLMVMTSPLLTVSAGSLNYMNIPHEGKHKPEVDDKVHLFSVDGVKIPYNYINDTGSINGFDADIVQEVCSIAKKKCKVILGEFTECIFTDNHMSYVGRGIQSGWYDGCPGFEMTVDRMNILDFTLPYLVTSAGFAVLPGNPKNFDPDAEDYSGFNIVHLTGAPTNVQCLTRLRKRFDLAKISICRNLTEAKELLYNGTVDVIFSPRNNIGGVELLPARLQCGNLGGAGILLKKGSDVASWWNPAFRQFYQSGGYQALCDEAMYKYGAAVQCLPPPALASPELLALLHKPDEEPPEKLWKFVVSGSIAPFSYLNTEGELVGFTKDMIKEVCDRAGKSCILTLAQVSECTKRIGESLFPQRGLMENWFDACTGYFNTEDRRNSWDFTGPYLVSNATFKVMPGNPKNFDPTSRNFNGFTLVHAATAITNDHCLNRLHKSWDSLMVVPDAAAAEQAVLDGRADVWFTKEVQTDNLETLAPAVHCENVGTSVMVKKGSKLPEWWDAAFDEFYLSGEFNMFCDQQGRKHTYEFPCLPPPPVIDHSKKRWPVNFEGY